MTDRTTIQSASARGSRIAVTCTLALLIGIATDRFVLGRPAADAEAYHERVRTAAAEFPYHFDSWLSVDAPVPQAAVTMLKPNFLISRDFSELAGNRHVRLLVIHCRDSRDILGHYPPVCYVNQGWALESAQPQDWLVKDILITGTRYQFKIAERGISRGLVIDNFLLLPNGQIARNMDDVEMAAQDTRLKYYGAAQVQLVYDQSLTEADRRQAFNALVGELFPVLKAVMNSGRTGGI